MYKRIGKKLKAQGHRELISRYNNMVNRCINPRNAGYPYYGLKGIDVCDEWLEDREAFIEWSWKICYIPDACMHIHRYNPHKDYTPDNCVYLYEHEHIRIHQLMRGW